MGHKPTPQAHGSQHLGAAARIKALEDALQVYKADSSRLVEFSRAFDNYAEFYRNHMILEEVEIIPLARQHLTTEDWWDVDRVFAAEPDPMGGTREKPEDFAAVFSKLVASAPAPIGLGAGPYQG